MKRKGNGQSLGNGSFPNILGSDKWQITILSLYREVAGWLGWSTSLANTAPVPALHWPSLYTFPVVHLPLMDKSPLTPRLGENPWQRAGLFLLCLHWWEEDCSYMCRPSEKPGDRKSTSLSGGQGRDWRKRLATPGMFGAATREMDPWAPWQGNRRGGGDSYRYHYVNAARFRNYFTCLTRSGQHPISGSST